LTGAARGCLPPEQRYLVRKRGFGAGRYRSMSGGTLTPRDLTPPIGRISHPLKIAAILLALWTCVLSTRAFADETIPPRRRAILLTRILAYDSALAARAGSTFVICVVFHKGNAASEAQAKEMLGAFKELEKVMISGLPLRATSSPFTTGPALETLIDGEGIDALFVCEGLEDELAAMKQTSRKRKILTVGTTNAQVVAGISVGVLSENGKLQIVVNLPQSRDEGAEFGSDLLRVARVVR
jgi:hypothetical protein